MRLSTHIIGQGDTIEDLSLRLLGELGQEDTLIRLNKLRYPYISDKQSDQLSGTKGTLFVSSTFTNPTTIIYDNPNGIVVLPNDTISFSRGRVFVTGIVQSLTPTTITFTNTVQGVIDSGTIITVYSNQQNTDTQVLKTGDALFYPFDDVTSETVNTSILGSDWKLSKERFLIRFNRDVATVSGYENLLQAISLRLNTPISSLRGHPDYGNEMFDHVGDAGTPHFVGLMKHFAVECALQDPRVSSAEVTSYSIQEDGSALIDLLIVPIGLQNAIKLSASVPLTGV